MTSSAGHAIGDVDLSAQSDGQLTLFDAERELGFSHDIRRGAFPGGTVTYIARCTS